MKDFIGLLLRVFIPIIGLILVFLPLWYVGWKVKNKTWWHYIGAVVGMGVIFFTLNFFLSPIHKFVQNRIYDSHSVLDGIVDGNIILTFLVIGVISLSPLIFTKKMYGKYNLVKIILSLILAMTLFIIQSIAWAYYIAAGLGQVGAKYF